MWWDGDMNMGCVRCPGRDFRWAFGHAVTCCPAHRRYTAATRGPVLPFPTILGRGAAQTQAAMASPVARGLVTPEFPARPAVGAAAHWPVHRGIAIEERVHPGLQMVAAEEPPAEGALVARVRTAIVDSAQTRTIAPRDTLFVDRVFQQVLDLGRALLRRADRIDALPVLRVLFAEALTAVLACIDGSRFAARKPPSDSA